MTKTQEHDPMLRAGAEPDVWVPAGLDLESEQCWCLRCGEELPCTTCLFKPINQAKETTAHV